MNEEMIVNEVDLQTLRKTDWFTLAWAFIWRGIFTTLGSAIAGGIVGFIFGLTVAILGSITGVDLETTKLIGQIISAFMGLIIGFIFVIILIKWILKARFRNFRLTLVRLN
ncbi:MAG: hypothetical protein IID03_12830 [Candidatus Dadabacteria bacterium]|nr:hypothetical protein [Candidatus Dadabacteria bacterium]